jgi:hypothetical protein
MARTHLIQGSLVRAAYGILALVAPKLLFATVPGTKVDDDARYFNRLLGGRDLLVALGTIAAVRTGSEATALKANVFCEVTDSVSLVEEVRGRGKLDRMTVIGLLFNVGGYAIWLRAARALRTESASSAQSS